MKTYYIETLGCPKNEVDSEMMGQLLTQEGLVGVDSPEEADLLVVNTCAFIAPAREESYELLRELARRKKPGQKLVAAGCLSQRYAERLYGRVSGLDAVIGTRTWSDIGSIVRALDKSKAQVTRVSDEGNLVHSVQRANPFASAYLKIADGCNAACAYCAIPLIKGKQQSKPIDQIIREAIELYEQGAQEIVLIAQNTTAYGRDLGMKDGLPDLLDAICEAVPELPWLRILYTYPQDITPRLIETVARQQQVVNYLDLPLQHGDASVLRAMRRPDDVDAVRKLIGDIRLAIPNVALRTTFIVGFPNETEQAFENLLAMIRELKLDRMGAFIYSREEGTPAYEMGDPLPDEIKKERLAEVMSLQQEISLAKNKSLVGEYIEVLVDDVEDGISLARSYRDAPEIDGLVLIPIELPIGAMLPVRIIEAQEYDLVGMPDLIED